MSAHAMLLHFRQMKHYFIVVTLVFATGVALGYAGMFGPFSEANARPMAKLAKVVFESNHPQLYAFLLIFLNNVKSILFTFMFGGFLGFFPLFAMLTNGLVIGHLADGQPWWEFWIKGILPHGILEIPAILIAAAYGVKFGFLLVEALFSLPSAKRRPLVARKLVSFFKVTVPVLCLLGILLLVAAVIESTVTYSLVRS